MPRIDYTLSMPDSMPIESAADALTALRQMARTLPVVGVTQLMTLSAAGFRRMAADPEGDDPLHLWRTIVPKISANHEPSSSDGAIAVLPQRTLTVGVQLVTASHPLHLILSTYPISFTVENGAVISTGFAGWWGQGSWSWQDEASHAPEDVLSHLMAVAILADAQEAGLTVTVEDGSGFWQHRRLSALGCIPRQGVDAAWSRRDLESLNTLATLVDVVEMQPGFSSSNPGDDQQPIPAEAREGLS